MSTILITGANRGIGLELTHQCANDGWTVIACCRAPETAQKLNNLAARFDDGGNGNVGGRVKIHPLDVTNDAQRAALVTRLQGQPIDILFNNAGVSGDWKTQGFGQCQAEAWLEVMHVNVIAPMLMTQAFVENVATSERKIIANMSSGIGSISDAGTVDGRYIYRSSKAALNMVNVICAGDLTEREITVIALHPGWARTDMGGPDGVLSVEESAMALRRNLSGITFADSGRFMDIDGGDIAW